MSPTLCVDFISQYQLARQGTVVPALFTLAGALHLLSLALEKRVWVDKAQFEIFGPIHLVLIGVSGTKKSTAIRQAAKLWKKLAPEYPIGPNVCSREDVIRTMAKDCKQSYIDHLGATVNYSPMVFHTNELENLWSFKPSSWIQFMTDIYDESSFRSGTIARGAEEVTNPFLCLFGAATPEYFEFLFKQQGITNGILRRCLLFFVTQLPARVFDPVFTPESRAALDWCQAHLEKVRKLAGPFVWDPDARAYADEWDKGNLTPDDLQLFANYFETKDIIMQQIAMLVAAAQPEPQLRLTLLVVKRAIEILGLVEANLPKLAMLAGKNPQLATRIKMMDWLTVKDGKVPEHLFHRFASFDMQEKDYDDMLSMLQKTHQIVVQPYLHGQNYVFLPGAYLAMRKEQEASKGQAPAPTVNPAFAPSL